MLHVLTVVYTLDVVVVVSALMAVMALLGLTDLEVAGRYFNSSNYFVRYSITVGEDLRTLEHTKGWRRRSLDVRPTNAIALRMC